MRPHSIQRALMVAVGFMPLFTLPLSAQTSGVREVSASPHSLIALQTRVRYTTMIVLPENEEILDVICGDKDFWAISAAQNIAHVKPAKEGAATNLNLVTGSGAIYSFLLQEKPGVGAADLKVYVTADESAPKGTPKYYSAAQVQALETELASQRNAVNAAERRATEAIATHRQQYPAQLQFVYDTPKYERPFYVRAIWHDGQFTYLKADARELPALYEMQDGKPSLVNFQVVGGTYVVPKVLEQGYLALGKARLSFAQKGR
jgi:type IV secretory pathway VirB9-like protein